MGEEFNVAAKNVDIEAIMKDIKEKVKEKKQQGVYDKYNLDGLTIDDITQLKDEQDFLKYYIELIQHTCDIDIGDFEIPSKGGIFGKPIAKFKRIVWVLMRFYTYRLFSQQKEFNFQLVNTLMSMNKKLEDKVGELTNRIDELGKGKG